MLNHAKKHVNITHVSIRKPKGFSNKKYTTRAAMVIYTRRESFVAYSTVVSSSLDIKVLINTTKAQQIIMHAMIRGNTAGPGTPFLDCGHELVIIRIAAAKATEMMEKAIFVFFIFLPIKK